VFHVVVAAVLAFVLERLNAFVLHWLMLFPGMGTQGWVSTAVFAVATITILRRFPQLTNRWWAAILPSATGVCLFLLYDAFLRSDLLLGLGLEPRRIEWLLVVFYGWSFGSATWILTALLGAAAENLPYGTSKFAFIRNAKSPVLVVFVHGLTGDAETTWGSFPALLAEDSGLSRVDVCVWGYPTKIAGHMPGIREAATQLQSELRHRAADYRHIVLVGHSLGGLLIRALVVAALKDSRIEDVQSINHIVTFATPNDGVEIADIVSFFRLPNRQIDDLAMTGETVNELRGEWIERVYSPNIRPGEERSKRQIPLTTVIGLQDRLVPFDRARSFFRHPPPETVPGDHVSMKLPKDRESLCYLILRNILKALCNGDDHGPTNPIAVNGESPHERPVEGRGPNRSGPPTVEDN
jgi:pimeloyl-ACP methyl ester carboxylesterase